MFADRDDTKSVRATDERQRGRLAGEAADRRRPPLMDMREPDYVRLHRSIGQQPIPLPKSRRIGPNSAGSTPAAHRQVPDKH
jgi:hypothetical protein